VKKRIFRKAVMHIILTLVVCYTILPIVWMGLTSLKTEREIYSIPITFFPHEPTLENYKRIFTEMEYFPRYLFNSAFVTTISTLITVLVGALAGYALARFDFKFKNSFLIIFLLLLAIPYGVYLIPLYIMEFKLNLLNTYTGLIIPYTAVNLPWAIFVLRATFRTIPRDIEDSAKIDGCGYWKTFWKVMLPIGRQGTITAAVFTFINIWSELLFVMSLTETNEMRTLPYGILLLRDEAQAFAYSTLAPAIVISILPTLAMFILLQNYFVKGAVEGSLKG